MKEIKNWRKATEEVAKVFINKYFKYQVYGKDTWWISDEVGSILCVSDMFFNVDQMIEALELNATYEQLSDYYYAELDAGIEEPSRKLSVNFKNYVKYGFKLK